MILLDTCVLIWMVQAPETLSEKAHDAIADNAGYLFISAISAFEIALKAKSRGLELPMPPGPWFATALRLHGVREIPVTSAIAAAAVGLLDIHRDPFDRLIVATAIHHRLTVVTCDRFIPQYPDVCVTW